MNIKKWLWLKLLPNINGKHCGSIIYLTGQKSKRNNCFSLYLTNKNKESILLIDTFDKYRVIGRILDENRIFSIPEGFPTDLAINLEIEIWHYYGNHHFIYRNIYEYILESCSGWDRFRAKSWDIYTAAAQWLFNQKNLESGERIDLLKFLVNKYSKGKFSITDVMLQKFGRQVFGRPDCRQLSNDITTILRFLVDTNELIVNNMGEYSITGHGWKAVNKYEETTRRVSAANKIQFGLFVLSFTVALLTAGQVGLIKFPTLLDLRTEVEKAAQEPKAPVTQINNYYHTEPSLKAPQSKDSSVQK